ncbi:bifunctional folylpolyglutamate synthase/dihydrofolate synthase [Naumannella sp. ID2617S]|nr:bifunctional folylpolyglutamate synthase/dihydrofolate synthase [Naumannella sp. ID2617S]
MAFEMPTNQNAAHQRLVGELTSRWPEHRVAPSLTRIRALTELLGDPQRAYPVIHVGGTNGKGSTVIMIESLLRAAGLRTGRYSSPHLVDVTERIAIDGQPVSAERFGEVWSDIEPYVRLVDEQAHDGVPMTFFEVLTGMAYAAFADAPVDVAVVEVGLGGGWDATNVADGTVAVLMPIDLDHTHLLGSTVAEIAAEKAGIIKPGAQAVLAGQPREAADVLLARCAEVGALPLREGIDFGLLDRRLAVGGQLIRLNAAGGPVDDIHLPLHGAHMARNAAVALAAAEAFLGFQAMNPEVVRDGFAEVTAPGRLEAVRQSPPIVLDGAHNPHAATASAEAVAEAYAFNPLVGVLAVMRDKDVDQILRVWEPLMTSIVCSQVSSTERGLPAEELAEVAAGIFGAERVYVRSRLDDALEWATQLADDDSGNPGVLVTGSVIAAGEARALLVADAGATEREEVDWEAEDHGGTLDELSADRSADPEDS